MAATHKVYVPNNTSVQDFASFLARVRAPVIFAKNHPNGVDVSVSVTHGAVTSLGNACTDYGFTFGGLDVTQQPAKPRKKKAEPKVEEEPESLAGLDAGILTSK